MPLRPHCLTSPPRRPRSRQKSPRHNQMRPKSRRPAISAGGSRRGIAGFSADREVWRPCCWRLIWRPWPAGAPPIEVTSLRPREWHYSVEINSATWVEWLQLPAIGESMARRIVEDREQRGPFRSIDDVARVRGIGPKTLARLRPFLRLDPDSSAANPESR